MYPDTETNKTSWLKQLSSLEEAVGWELNGVITSLAVKRTSKGWFVVMKAVIAGKEKVTFLDVDEWAEVWPQIVYMVTEGLFQWYDDKYPVRVK